MHPQHDAVGSDGDAESILHIPSYSQKRSPPPTTLGLFPMSSLSPPALQQLHGIDRTVSGFPDELSNVLYGEEYQQSVPNIEGDDLVTLVDDLEGVSCRVVLHRDHPVLKHDRQALDALDPSCLTFRKCLLELRSVCRAKGTLPTSYTIPSHLLNIGPNPFASGGFGDVYHGTLNDLKVSIKRVRIYDKDGPGKATKVCYWLRRSFC